MMSVQNIVVAEIGALTNVLYARSDGMLCVDLNRAEALNAIDSVTAEQLSEVWSWVQADSSIHSIILSAVGVEAFCIGFDALDPPKQVYNARSRQYDPVPISPKECGVDKRVIVAVNGFVRRDSFRFLRDADIVVASCNASFFEPYIMNTRDGETARPMTFASALRMLRANKPTIRNPVTALQAQQTGLVREVVPLASLREAAERIAREDLSRTAA